ncbi:antibiotic biosynthesis monooxygenase family protein [Brevibacterium otitidis]|uniref:Antibiotic biosynthesis monooxygenase family protein n=1 Tax=Brevibacterium otitidis TaxID=53364 RepID=A0ABV5X335_9MICO|nr:antibiotic biosynthesis monooxygenase [Brevibacterium otitidis]
MSVVKINALTVPAETGDEIVNRFAPAIENLDSFEGFEHFALLKPTDEREVWFVYTQWASEEAYEGWKNSRAFAAGHSGSGEKRKPVATGAELLEFVTALETSAR